MKSKHIDKKSILYDLLRTYVRVCIALFYRKIKITSKHKVPGTGPFIFAPNHQNAVMDTMAILYATWVDPVFMARADVFNNALVASILRFLKILPVYRIRDGFREVKKNDAVFREALGVLKRKNPLCIMPEGNHGDKRRLRRLVKGIFRIALQAQENAKDEHVKILPVGIDYSSYTAYQSDLLINFGNLVDVHEYLPLYNQNPALAINELKDHVAREMRKLMIDIKNLELYHEYYAMKGIYNKTMRKQMNIRKNNLYNRFLASREIIRNLDEACEKYPGLIRSLTDKIRNYQKGLGRFGLADRTMDPDHRNSILPVFETPMLILLLPLFFYGLINNLIPCLISITLTRKAKDRQFHSSIKFVAGILLFPLFYLLQFLLVFWMTTGWIPWIYLASLPFSGIFAIRFFNRGKKNMMWWKYKLLRLREKSGLPELVRLREKIIGQMTGIIASNQSMA